MWKSFQENQAVPTESTPIYQAELKKWQVLLAEYDIVYMTRKAMKWNVIADHLTSHAMEDYEPLKFDFPDEDVLSVEEGKSDWWIMYFDGVVGNEVRAVLISFDKKHYPISFKS